MSEGLPINVSFQKTQWSVVSILRQRPDSPEARQALAKLCAIYWYPLYAFARRGRLGEEDAQDATQSFFAKIVRDNLFAEAFPEKGLLRAFLLTSFQNHMAKERARGSAAKRGGGVEMLPLDFADGENRFLQEPLDPTTPETHFDRNWARALMRSALESLGRQEGRAERGEQFAALRDFITDAEGMAVDYTAAAEKLGMTVEAVRTAVSRLRKKLARSVDAQIAQTLDAPDGREVEEERKALIAALAGR